MSLNFTPMTVQQVINAYFDAFKRNNLEEILTLFTEGAIVRASSQNYQKLNPQQFYKQVFDMTKEKLITVHSTAIDSQNKHIAIVHFGYDWTLSNGSRKNFTDAFDKFEINPVSGKITSLTINVGADVLVT